MARGFVRNGAKAAADAVCVSVIVAAGLRYGCAKNGSPWLSRKVEDFLAEVPVLAFEVPADGEYGRMRAEPEVAWWDRMPC